MEALDGSRPGLGLAGQNGRQADAGSGLLLRVPQRLHARYEHHPGQLDGHVVPELPGLRRVRAQVAEAQSGLHATELRRLDLERSVTQEIQTALSDLTITEQKLEIEKVKIKQAEDSLRIAEERFRNGLLSATELIDAQNTVENARLNSLQLVYNHTLSKFTLYRSCGRKI